MADATKTTIVLAGGGTGGHLYPGVAVAEALRDLMPEARVLFLCTRKDVDKLILLPTGHEFVPQPIVPPLRSVGGLLRFWKNWRETHDLVHQVLRDRAPGAVLGLGGYAETVAVRVAARAGIPTAVLNPDVIPGKANQFLIKQVGKICCQFPQTAQHLSAQHRGKVEVTGCPIRRDIAGEGDDPAARRAEAMKRLGLNSDLNTLVVTGASLGAQTVNEAALESFKSVKLQGWQVLHLSGREHAAAVREGYRALGTTANVIDFTPAMADVWSVADLAVSRAGASSCAELTARGVPSLLMPYPYHKDMHQRENARVLADAGAAVLIDDEKEARSNAARLTPALEQLLYDANRRAAMSAAARSLGKPGASRAVAQILTRMCETRR